jgi:uncharacterized protein YnzC (UPF0291/DUF896 family)
MLLDNTQAEWQSNRWNEHAYTWFLNNKWFGGLQMSMEETIERINQLARKAKTVGLTDEEIDERNELRKQYIEIFKGNLKMQLDSIRYIEDEEKQ